MNTTFNIQVAKEQLKPGRIYKRRELCGLLRMYSACLKDLAKEDAFLSEIADDLYYYSKSTVFGPSAPSECEVVEAFLGGAVFISRIKLLQRLRSWDNPII